MFAACNFPFCLMDFLPWIYKRILYIRHILFILLLLIGCAVALVKLQSSHKARLPAYHWQNIVVSQAHAGISHSSQSIHFVAISLQNMLTHTWIPFSNTYTRTRCMLSQHCHFLQAVTWCYCFQLPMPSTNDSSHAFYLLPRLLLIPGQNLY